MEPRDEVVTSIRGEPPRINQEDEGDIQRRSDHRRPAILDGPSLDLLQEMRKEMDKLRNTIKGKIN